MGNSPKNHGTAQLTQLDFDAGRLITVLFFVLVGIEVFFVLADAIINVGELSELGPVRRFFNITREDGVASWFGVTQTWMLGLTAAFIYALVRAGDAPRWRQGRLGDLGDLLLVHGHGRWRDVSRAHWLIGKDHAAR